MDIFVLNAETRTDMGKGASRRLRRDGNVPGIIYGGDKAPQMLTVNHNDLLRRLENEAFYSHVLTLNIDGNTESAVLKALQRHPAKPFVLHADFQRVDMTHKIHMHIPIHFINEDNCVGVKIGGGSISHQMVEVEVHCLPQHLPEYLEVDMGNIEIGQVLHLSDLSLPEGVEIPNLTHGHEYNLPVVTVHKGHGVSDEENEGAEPPAA
jgi:large subunit ribosomal protein L25